jgi:DNA invertase Pin-like site-specific DNA recombinase
MSDRDLINLARDTITTQGPRLGLSDASANELAELLVQRLRREAPGPAYIAAVDRHERNQRIMMAFDGVNHDAVCRQYDISLPTLYRILGNSSKAPTHVLPPNGPA